MKYNIAIVGATGVVGRKMLEMLDEFNIPINQLYLFASRNSAGKVINFKDKEFIVEELNEENVLTKKIDYALFSAGKDVSANFAPLFAKESIVIDNSSCFRMRDDVPLIVPEVNTHSISGHKNIIANPNCSTIQAVVALSPLHKKYKIKRVIYSTYQAVSGAGQSGINDLVNGINGKENKHFPYPIFKNILPHIDSFLEDGYTKEEHKMINETRKILDDDNIAITSTTVRVPVLYGHSISINVEFEKEYKIEDIFNILKEAKGVVVYDDIKNNIYPMPIIAENRNEVFVGRIRRDFSVANGLNLWVVADNIRKGAATNAVQILKYFIDEVK